MALYKDKRLTVLEQPVELKPEAVPSAQKVKYDIAASCITILKNRCLLI